MYLQKYIVVNVSPVNVFVISTEKKYFQSDWGSDCDKLGLPNLMSEEDCKEAANSTSKKYWNATDTTNDPMGCYENSLKDPLWFLIFNRGTGGSADSSQRSMCSRQGKQRFEAFLDKFWRL